MDETKPKLRNITAFQDALENYEVSDYARKVLASTEFVVMSGMAGGGRNAVINELVKTGKYIFIVSDTTRPPKFRDGKLEVDGVNYYFRQEDEMLKDIQAGDFVEAEIIHNQQVSGTSIREVERVAATGKIPIHDFEFGGANNVAHAKSDAFIIGLLPPSYDEWLRRFRDREEIHEDEFFNRLHTAEKVLENMISKPYFKFVINDSLAVCADQIQGIVERGEYNKEMHKTGLKVANDLLSQVKDHLKNK